MILQPSSTEREHEGPSTPSTSASSTASGGIVIASIWATGPDTSQDGIFRLEALRIERAGGEWRHFDVFCRPFSSENEHAAASKLREHGLQVEDLADARSTGELWPAFRSFVGSLAVLTADREVFRAWHQHLDGVDARGPTCLGLSELEGLLLPGRLARGPSILKARPHELRSRFRALIGRFLSIPDSARRCALQGLIAAWRGLQASDENAAERLGFVLHLLDRPTLLTAGIEPAGEFPVLSEGLVTRALSEKELDRFELDLLDPPWSDPGMDLETLPATREGPLPFAEEDARALDELFEVHLPQALGGSYRSGQHAVAREVASALGSEELLLVHAPTGTGKTLAYLVPALLWAARHGVRVGVATYTRALQEQALELELPRARAALACFNGSNGKRLEASHARVACIKGRDNYLCWRALKLAMPTEQDGADTWLAWTQLLLFALSDEYGDLDRFPRRPAFTTSFPQSLAAEIDSLLLQTRAHSGCCSSREDRATCAAECSRQRAERSHVVIANHAFVLARPNFFRHIVFDECEHLHEQAHGLFSHALSISQLRRLHARLRRGESAGSRAPLDRIERLAPEGSRAALAVRAIFDAGQELGAAIEEMNARIAEFKTWRSERSQTLPPNLQHSLLREYLESELGGGIVQARVELSSTVSAAEAALSDVLEGLEGLSARGLASLRRTLELLRGEIADANESLEQWMPLEQGKPCLRSEVFYDVEATARGGDLLVARVLLPHEFLGRLYYPELKSAAFVSATTWLRGGFEAAANYLGLSRAADPLPSEEREGKRVRSFRAPDPFDYARVLVCAPNDAPDYGKDRAAFFDYVRRFLTHLGERTRGRILGLFTNSEDARKVGEDITGFFRARRIPLWYQNMPGAAKEELGILFRSSVDSVLLGVDTFWFGADFPGETLEYLVIVKLPYGVPDRYHHAQCAALGEGEQRKQIYMPRALAKFRQGFGRLMRRETDRGVVFLLDRRVLDPRHRTFLRELPLAGPEGGAPLAARWLRASTDRCIQEALSHMDLLAEVRRRGLCEPFQLEGRPGG